MSLFQHDLVVKRFAIRGLKELSRHVREVLRAFLAGLYFVPVDAPGQPLANPNANPRFRYEQREV